MSVIPLDLRRDETRRLCDVPDVDIVIPVYNEERQLEASITSLRAYLDTTFPFSSTITIAGSRTGARSTNTAADPLCSA